MFRKTILLALGAAAVLSAGGCYIDDHCRFCGDDLETIRYENHTDLLVDNFIDGEYVGTVSRQGRLDVDGDYEGRHVFESSTPGDELHWGPTEFRIGNGELFVLDLTDSRIPGRVAGTQAEAVSSRVGGETGRAEVELARPADLNPCGPPT